jgi:type IV pilus assembly protein PilW
MKSQRLKTVITPRIAVTFGANPRRGLSLIELMISMTLGLFLTFAIISAYLSSKQAFNRQDQLNAIQQNVRLAFEYLASDLRMVGHKGCYTGKDSGFINDLKSGGDHRYNFAAGVEGYEYTVTSSAYTLGSDYPANVTTGFETNLASSGGVTSVTVSTIAGSAPGDGVTPGSDIVIARSVTGAPIQSNATSSATQLSHAASSTATGCYGGLCANSLALVASCSNARVFQVSAISASTITHDSAGSAPGNQNASWGESYDKYAEYFPVQTAAYYVKRSSRGTTTSLYRRVFDGTVAAGVEQELVEGVENMQVRYGVDTSTDWDGVIDSYVAANAVGDWNRVVAVRVSLLLRSPAKVQADLKVATSGKVGDVTVTYPANSNYDRRVFTTTVAVRNRIKYLN